MLENYNDHLKSIVSNLPEGPGCYQYLDAQNKVIYVGKAKNLKRRVSSYFNKNQGSSKTAILVRKIKDIKYIVVKSDEDALLLENNLIKRYKPRYNVLLKDDKTYPSICISNEYFPRIYKTRKIVKNGSAYFGPYSHVQTMNSLLELIKKSYNIRTCNLNLTPENIASGKFKVCLKYHIKRCDAPCVGYINIAEYQKNISNIKQILNGNTNEVCKELKEQMNECAEKMEFEKAEALKKKLIDLESYIAKSEVVSRYIHNVDTFNIEEDEDNKTVFINYLHVNNGAINQAFTFEYTKKLDETKEELLSLGIVEMRERYHSTSREIIVPFQLDLPLQNITITIPQRGEKKTLLDLSKLNVKQYRADRQKKQDKLNPEQKQTRILKELQGLLGLDKLPMRIECFDNSNTNGTNAVAGCVVFIHGKPSKSDYRKYIIKTVEGPDDYGSMQEVVLRKYSRAIIEKKTLPDLIITDGGKGQMSSVKETLTELGIDIPVAGLAKDSRHKTSELLFGDPIQTIGTKQGTAVFNLLTRIQDEVHRFAITFHKEKRSKSQIQSELDNIKGIGEKTKNALLKKLQSKKRIQEASLNTLQDIVGKNKGEIIYKYFHKE